MTEYRRILLDGYPTQVVRDGEELVAGDGRRVAIVDALHLPPVEPTKAIAVHLNYEGAGRRIVPVSDGCLWLPERYAQILGGC